MSTAFTLFGKFTIPIFPLALGIGAGFGVFWSTWQLIAVPKLVQDRLRMSTYALTGALIGGRAAYVGVNWLHFQDHLIEIPQVWLGGISWAGALAGALLALPLAARAIDTPAAMIADRLLPLFVSLAVSSWLACWVTGHAYGVEVDAWWGIPGRDEWGVVAARWPTQLVGALAALGIYWGVELLRDRKRLKTPGLAASLEIAGLALTLLVLSPFRADPAPRWNGIRLDTIAAILLFGMSTVAAFILFWREQKLNRPFSENRHEN